MALIAKCNNTNYKFIPYILLNKLNIYNILKTNQNKYLQIAKKIYRHYVNNNIHTPKIACEQIFPKNKCLYKHFYFCIIIYCYKFTNSETTQLNNSVCLQLQIMI